MKLTGRIKTIIFKGERVSVLLEDTQVFTEDQKWMPYTDITLVKDGKYKKGETWLSSFKESIYQGCRELSRGVEVEVGVIVTERGFKNIESIGLKLPEVDVLEDTPLDEPFPEEKIPPEEESTTGDIMAEIEATHKDVLIIRQTCIKAVGAIFKISQDKWARDVDIAVAIATRLEKYVLEGK